MQNTESFITLDFISSLLQQCAKNYKKLETLQPKIEIKWALTNNIVGILGASGSGKTTLLKRMAGLISPIGSTLKINDNTIKLTQPGANPCAYVGADAPLFEHLSLLDNLTLIQSRSLWSTPASAKGLCQAIGIDSSPVFTIEQVAQLCEIEHLLSSRASTLSGGEKQRGQLARALLSGKPILLLDEAFSAMDWALRCRLHQRLITLSNKNLRAIVMVSHSSRELALMSDYLVHIQNGLIVNTGPTLEELAVLQDNQDVLFSALRVTHIEDEQNYELSVFALAGSQKRLKIYSKLSTYASTTDRLLVDANTVVLSKQLEPRSSMLNQLPARIDSIIDISGVTVVCLNVDGQCLYSHISKKSRVDMQLQEGETIYAMFKAI